MIPMRQCRSERRPHSSLPRPKECILSSSRELPWLRQVHVKKRGAYDSNRTEVGSLADVVRGGGGPGGRQLVRP